MKKKQSISQVFVFSMLLVTIISISLIGCLWTWQQYVSFHHESEVLKERMIESYRNLLKIQVQKAVDYIEYNRSLTEERLQFSIRDRIYQAHAVASHILETWHNKKPPREIQVMIKESLRAQRFNQGRGYFFILDLDGIVQLQPDRPEFEGHTMLENQDNNEIQVVRDMINLAVHKKEGFYRYNWTRPGTVKGRFPKIAFVKLFAPYNWIIGTGEYLNDFESSVKQDVLNYLETMKFSPDGYIFVTQWDGVSLTKPAKGKNMMNVTDPNGVMIVRKLIALSKSGGGFLRYVMPKLKDMKPDPKISYVQGIKEWEWYVGAGVYIDDIEAAVKTKHAEMRKKITNSLVQIMVALWGLLLATYLVAKRTSRNARNSFELFSQFFDKGTLESAVIDPDAMKYKEFEKLAHSANDMIKARTLAEEALRENQAWLRNILDSIQAGVVVIDPKTHEIIEVNRAAAEMIGAEKEQVVDKICHNHICPNDLGRCPITDLGLSIEQSDRELMKIDGTLIPILKTVNCAKINGKEYLIESFLDMSEKKRLELLLLQAQKMESIGTLAGGIAHDFNNILFPIMGMSEMLMEDFETNSPEYEMARQIFTASIRAGDLVKQILAFSRQSELKMLPVRIQQVLQEALNLTRSTIPSNIEITSDIQTDCGLILANPIQLHQIAMNLITNAYHAIEPSNGMISITLKEIELSASDSADTILQPDRYALLNISDCGRGIDPSIMDKIFEPYFTTKVKGKGTGLGLSVVYGIVREHHGDIKILSEFGKGTTVTVYLPLMKDSDISDTNEKTKGLQTGNERILLVDDEESVVILEKQMLERLRYKVTSRVNSLEALEAFKARPNAFDMVITDMSMPNMTGDQLAKELLLINPGLPVLICTGFSEQINQERAKNLGIKGFLMKPMVKSELAKTVRSIFDETGKGKE